MIVALVVQDGLGSAKLELSVPKVIMLLEHTSLVTFPTNR